MNGNKQRRYDGLIVDYLTETAEQLFGIEPRSEADCEYPLEPQT